MSVQPEEISCFPKISCFRCGNSQILSPGFKFHPTDEELINHYLRHKVFNNDFTSLPFQEKNLNELEPWDLLNLGEKEGYFFMKHNSKFPSGRRTNRATPAGYWKASGTDKSIYSSGKLVGKKKTHVFYKGKAPTAKISNWGMDEYCLNDISNSSKDKDWMIARVYQRTGLSITERIGGGARVSITSDQEQPSLDVNSFNFDFDFGSPSASTMTSSVVVPSYEDEDMPSYEDDDAIARIKDTLFSSGDDEDMPSYDEDDINRIMDTLRPSGDD